MAYFTTPINPAPVGAVNQNAAVAAGTGAADVPIKAAPGFLGTVTVTAAGSAAMNLWDNAATHSGTVLCAIPSSATVGQVFQVNMPAANGITATQASGSPAITVSYS